MPTRGRPLGLRLKYRDKDNSEKTPLCIHRAPLGTHERFIGFLIEHYAGNFPLWLAPEQVRVLTLNADDNLIAYAKDIAQQLRAAEVRVTSDLGPEPIKAKIADAESAKVHTMLVIGGRDVEAGNVSVRLHGKGNVGAKAGSGGGRFWRRLKKGGRKYPYSLKFTVTGLLHKILVLPWGVKPIT